MRAPLVKIAFVFGEIAPLPSHWWVCFAHGDWVGHWFVCSGGPEGVLGTGHQEGNAKVMLAERPHN